ncbi:MAG: hypothetical protein QG577_349 [Thermodesulfobacteriota bacterium]|nr:hypothetical protein [Thermodesulfobacteriota bacterium]
MSRPGPRTAAYFSVFPDEYKLMRLIQPQHGCDRGKKPILWLPCFLVAVLVFPSGCLTRQGDPSLPYVKPANSYGAMEPAPGSAHLAARILEMEQEVQKLRDLLERQQAAGVGESQLKHLQERVAFIERQLGIEPNVSLNPRTPSPQPGQSAAGQPQGTLDQPKNERVASSGTQSSQQPLELVNPPQNPEEKAYRDAYAAYKNGDFDQAVRLFEAFLAKFPKSELSQNAVYWMGETRFAQGRFDEAVLQFDRVIKEFPGSKKELNSLLRQAQAFEKMGDNRSARIIFQKILTDHPHSAQARIATTRLKSLPQTN